jgi:hypothetical protein
MQQMQEIIRQMQVNPPPSPDQMQQLQDELQQVIQRLQDHVS